MSGNNNGRRWLVPLVPVVMVALAAAVAWGESLSTDKDHDRRILTTEEQVRVLETTQATILERVNQIKDLGDDNKKLLNEVLRTLRTSPPR